jgi:hypothetical protein
VALGYAIESNIFKNVSEDDANITVTLTSVIYKDDVPVTEVNPGDEVIARVFVNVSEPITAMDMILVWDSDAFDDRLSSTANSDLSTNPNYGIATAKYYAYSCGDPRWEDFSVAINGEDEEGNEITYITEEMYEKYKNSWVYINMVVGGAKTFDGTDWVFEIPLTVKDDAALGESNPAFGIVEDTFSAMGIGDYNWDDNGLAGITDANFEDFNSRIPYLTTNDAVVTVEAAASTAIVMFDAGATDATLTGEDIYEDVVGTEVAVPTAARTGYHLTGWDADGDGTADLAADATTVEIPATDTTYTAMWAPNTHTLTINYYKENTTEAVATAYVKTDAEYAGVYDVPSPTVTGYHLVDATQSTVEVIMDDQDETVNVYYAPNTEGVTINYLIQGTTTALGTPYTASVNYGETYSADSPAFTGYHLVDETQATVSGTM